MDAAYLQHNVRELELTKHVSLAQVMPLSLLALKTAGTCTVQLPEWLFDMDFPGHYRRRLRSVAVTIPCVVGPYGGVHCTLSLVRNGMRANDAVNGGYGDPLVGGDTRFVSNRVPLSSIATSHAQNDSGVFELNFNDERFLPFEGAGAVSEWQLSLPKPGNAFDFATISDVVLHVRYTARAGGPALADAASDNLAAALPANGFKLLSLRNDFGSEWSRFLHAPDGVDQTLAFTLRPEHFPFFTRSQQVRVTGVDLLLESMHPGAFDVVLGVPGTTPGAPEPAPRDPTYGNVHHFGRTVTPARNALGDWTLKLRKDTATTFRELTADDVRNAYFVVRFTTAP